jgi:hypothetical protein
VPDTSNSIVSDSFSEALETMAFICPLPPELPAAAPTNTVIVTLPFDDEGIGALELVAPREFGLLLAANQLGAASPADQADKMSTDALKELMNITCGVMLAKLVPDGGQPREMGFPVAHEFNRAEWEEFVSSPGASVWDGEGHIFAVRMRGTP